MSGLTIKKYGYSRDPWRFDLDGREFWINGQPYFSFPRKRDAKAMLDRLLSIGDWTAAEAFTVEQRRQVMELAKTTDVYRLFNEIRQSEIERKMHYL